MQGLEHYVGEVLDDKYRLEQLLGQGGMGAVYLATHLGTERYVALKLIAPQFMRNEEFVERFKREARAAGRLRHPNVVDATDFGFARVKEGRVAYLVMEYLDGCTLGDVLAEEKRLPLEWVVDILEQVCSAVHEAHQQGIVHRDLKPDNIWLEPNRLGSYRVKVLDFGIAKLAEPDAPPLEPDDGAKTLINDPSFIPPDDASSTLRMARTDHEDAQRKEQASQAVAETPGAVKTNVAAANDFVDDASDTRLFAAGTAIRKAQLTQPNIAHGDEDGTLLFGQSTGAFGTHTAHIATSPSGPALTRVGAIMGTPLYMSPEQCGGGHVDTRSDIYSVGVIAYQMLAGEPPFAGQTAAVMRAHLKETPRNLHEHSKKIPKRVAGVVMSALQKDPAERPQTAFAFASSLRGHAEGIGALYRRAFSLYVNYFTKFVKLSFIAHIPVIVAAILMSGLFLADKWLSPPTKGQKIAIVCAMVIVGLFQIVAYFVSAATISGVTAIIVTQLSAAPLRPVKLREAFAVLRKRWKPFFKTALLVTLRILIGYLLLIIPGLVMTVRYALYAPVVLIEGLEKKAARLRARELASRSWRTIIIVSILQVLIPMTVSILVGRIRVGFGDSIHRNSTTRQIYQQFLGLVNIFIVPFASIVPALLYLKMRQLGGEKLSEVLAQIEEVDSEKRDWQRRMRTRLSLHTPTRTTGQ
ncbi:MAG TPA: serine/threonine-protein kinase [Pyrinomonadaceae bacterium]